MTHSEDKNKPVSNPVNDKHSPKAFIRGNQTYFICDHCQKEIKSEDATKISKGRQKDYVYCPECTKILYPNYRKIAFYNPNPVMTGILHEALARKEYRRQDNKNREKSEQKSSENSD